MFNIYRLLLFGLETGLTGQKRSSSDCHQPIKQSPLLPAKFIIPHPTPHIPQTFLFICFNENPLKIMKNAFYFILKALFVLKIFEFLS